VRFAALVRRAGPPVYALGGVDSETARRLLPAGAAGVAAIGGIAG
jgi:thiamine monophosphate synthase